MIKGVTKIKGADLNMYTYIHSMFVAVYFEEMRRETTLHFFGLWAVSKKRSGQFIRRRKATLWKA